MERLYKTEEQARFISMMNDLKAKFGYDNSKIARLCGISPAMITHIENGDRSPRLALERLETKYRELMNPQAAGMELREAPPDYVFDDLVSQFETVKENLAAMGRSIDKIKKRRVDQAAQKAGKTGADELRHGRS